MIKILFAPYPSRSHIIPLLVLYQKYFSQLSGLSCFFLLPNPKYYLKRYNISVLDFDNTLPTHTTYKNLPDLKSIPSFLKDREDKLRKFRPDILIDDFSFEIAEFCELNDILRISIQRTGYFRTLKSSLRNSLHIHSIEKYPIEGQRRKVFKYDSESNSFNFYVAECAFYTNQTNIFNPKAKIIPGVSSIEKLPSCLEPESYYYSGPLIPNDNADKSLLDKISVFFSEHINRKKIFITTGLVEQQDTSDIFKHIVKRGYAIITTIFPPYDVDKSKIFYHPFLPLHFISERVDLMIHHCGSGMYHYPLLYLKPSITLGSQCYDREDIALQLQKLHLSAHVPSLYDDRNYMEKFIENIDKFENDSLCDCYSIEKIKNKIIDTEYKFNAGNIIKTIL